MIPTNVVDYDVAGHDLPLELRRARTVHRNEDFHPGLMLAGVVTGKEQDEVIPSYLMRQNLVVPAYPFRTTCASARPGH
jgi:hypothetical protein